MLDAMLDATGDVVSLVLALEVPNAQCPMPNAQCPMPNAQCPALRSAHCPEPSAR